MQTSKQKRSKPIGREPLWYKDAVIYELHVRAFFDSNNDGIGDFRGLTKKLDYLSDLGVTALWLLPFYPSPRKDDGYDIADYMSIDPSFGTLQDFKEFMAAAHKRGMRVITELVLNHTSDQHAWFQRSRRAGSNNPWRDFYVWTDDPSKYKEARIIFKDFEPSNWSWDPVAQAYYWHRFYHHQPDLNFENPKVRRRLSEVMDFWLELGVDGLRLDAVPYLFEKENTSCENLPETHAYLKELRAHIDSKFPDRMLLAEANQWPEDAVAYFGDGDECHMCFHFPLMPRLFMALKLEDRFSIIDILNQTPPIPEQCQWATFLRNHDELTLEMVTDEERDYMYNLYASDPQARINLGIRRRLAPLLHNDRRQVELLNALLFSLPGTPVLYYGDEIGMGDNIYLGDRNGVRTPFQWSSDRNAGFSRADPQQLYLPVIITPEYHYATVNVENQQNNHSSLLWWMKNLISLRKQREALNRGTIEFLHPENTKVLAFLREYNGRHFLMVANLSRRAQCVELDLSRFEGMRPIEALGRVKFPPIGKFPYFITLGRYSFYWFDLIAAEDTEVSRRMYPGALSSIDVSIGPINALQKEDVQRNIEANLPQHLLHMRWFAGKGKDIESVDCMSVLPLEVTKDRSHFALMIVRVSYSDHLPDYYLLALGYAEGDHAQRIMEESPQAVVAKSVRKTKGEEISGIYYDATIDVEFFQEMLNFILKRRGRNASPVLVTEAYGPVRKSWITPPPKPTIRGFEQSNTAVIYDNQLFFKLYRRLETGTNPEIEMGRHLQEKTTFTHKATLLAALRHDFGRKSMNLGLLQSYVPNEGDAWKFTIDYLSKLAEEVAGIEEPFDPKAHDDGHVLDNLASDPPVSVLERYGYYLSMSEVLGQRIGQMHCALAQWDADQIFAPEEFTPFYQRSLYQSMRNVTDQTVTALRSSRSIPDHLRPLADELVSKEDKLYKMMAGIKDTPMDGYRIRCHGDLHLGQVLFTGKDFAILDFEGEPARSIGERRLKRTPIRDVAGMLRSFDYAADFIARQDIVRVEDLPSVIPHLREWSRWAKAEFLKGYLGELKDTKILPSSFQALRVLMNVYLLDKVLYEIRYELNNRPDWVEIPLQGALEMIQSDTPSSAKGN